MAQQSRRFLRLREVQHQTGLGRSALYQAIREGKFPRPYSIGPRSVAWASNEVDAWMDSRVTASRRAAA